MKTDFVVYALLAALTAVFPPGAPEEGSYKKSAVPVAPAVKNAPAKTVTAKTGKTPPQKKMSSRKDKTASSSAAPWQPKAFKKPNDYNYVKHFSPITGPMYRSTKW